MHGSNETQSICNIALGINFYLNICKHSHVAAILSTSTYSRRAAYLAYIFVVISEDEISHSGIFGKF